MKVHVGTVVGARCVGDVTSVQIRMTSGAVVDLRASTRVAIEAIVLIGRTVRFRAELSEHTLCLSAPVFTLNSSYSLQAISAG